MLKVMNQVTKLFSNNVLISEDEALIDALKLDEPAEPLPPKVEK